MAAKSFGIAIGASTGVEAAGFTALFAAVQTATTDALAVSGLDAVTGATTAVTAIGTASTAVETALLANAVTLHVNTAGSPTKAQVLAAIARIVEQINTSNVFT